MLVGASGLVGSHPLRPLIDDEAYDRATFLVRKSLSFRHLKLKEVVVAVRKSEQIQIVDQK